MPYAQNNLKDEELKNQQTGSAPNISGTSTTFATGVPGQESSKKSSGQYANIQSYLDTNQEQAGEMGNKLASSVEQKGTEAKAGVDKLASSVSKIEAYDPNAAIGKANSLTADEKAQYQSIKSTGGYTGPRDIGGVDNYQDVETKARQATEAAKGASTEQGQQALLKETYARPTYSAGQNKLDQVLLGGSQTGKKALQDVSSKYSGLEDLFKDTSTQVGNTINDNINTAYYNQQAFTPAEQAAKDALLNPIQARAQQKNIDNPAAIARAQDDLSDENVFDDILSKIGLQEGQNIYDLNLANYLNPNQTQVGINNVATNDERMKYQALSDLFGDTSMSQITSSGSDIDPYTFDRAKFDADRTGKEAEYKKAYNESINTITPVSTGNPGNDYWIKEYLRQFTPQRLENELIPLQIKIGNMDVAKGLQDSIDNWKNGQYKANRAINLRKADKQGTKGIGSESFGGN